MTARVVICDDSRLMRDLLTQVLNREQGVAVVGVAGDPYEARDVIKSVDPDVVTLDIDMPRMDGLTFLDRIMRLRPTPVIMISTHTAAGADLTIQALERGAVDAIGKPQNLSGDAFDRFARDLGARVRAAARAKVEPVTSIPPTPRPAQGGRMRPKAVITVGASTGGVEALNRFLAALPPNAPPIAIVQHMPARFTAHLAARLNDRLPLTVSEAVDGGVIGPGACVIAPGDRHLRLEAAGAVEGGGYRCRLSDEDTQTHRPSVDFLFHSAAVAAGADGVGVILTGMGHDGAEGLLAMRAAGAATLAQSKTSALVYGMPKAAKTAGAVEREGDLEELAAWAMEAACAHAKPHSEVGYAKGA